jgi:hypothetical protein
MKRLRTVAAVLLVSAAAGSVSALVVARHSHPVLLRLFTNCACTDYSGEVTGLTLFNPFRNRAPEVAADAFLEDIRQGRCSVTSSGNMARDCTHTGFKPIAFEWRLKNRHDMPNHLALYYQFTRLDGEHVERWSGEGVVGLSDKNGVWKPQSFDVIW